MAQDMTWINSLWNPVAQANQQLISENLKQISLSEKRKKLQDIQNYLLNYYKIIIPEKKRTTRWSKILNEAQDYEIDYEKILEKKEDEIKFKQQCLLAYTLVNEILADLALIRRTHVTVTSISGKNYDYFRFPNLQFSASYTFLNPQSSKRGKNYGLRISSKQINILKKKQEKTEAQKALSQHFQAFIKPFVEYKKVAKTKWKPNKGVLGETFERHLERKIHNDIQDLRNNSIQHLESIGRRWLLYKESSGSDPFYTGPDTELAQVKNANASILSDLRTLIQAIEGVLTITDERGQLQKPKQELSQILRQADVKIRMAQAIYDDLLAQTPEVLKEMLKTALEDGITTITLVRKEGDNMKSMNYKINKQTLLLQIIKNNN